MAQTIDIRWGRIVAITTLEDTQKLAGALECLAARGVEEAGAPPIEDRVAAYYTRPQVLAVRPGLEGPAVPSRPVSSPPCSLDPL